MKRKLLKLLKMKNSVNQEMPLLGKKLSTNNFSMKTFFVLFFLHLFSFAALAQTGENDKSNVANGESAIDMSNYNLAPGMVLSPKKVNLEMDYSFMLNEIPATAPKNFKNDDFLRVIPKEKLDYWKASEPEVYQYYATAKNFYDNLSPKVKAIFSVEVLWHIYFYDQKLKSKLQAVK
jgi:hypothetical protein